MCSSSQLRDSPKQGPPGLSATALAGEEIMLEGRRKDMVGTTSATVRLLCRTFSGVHVSGEMTTLYAKAIPLRQKEYECTLILHGGGQLFMGTSWGREILCCVGGREAVVKCKAVSCAVWRELCLEASWFLEQYAY
jgi:hypothetical protein